MKAVFRRELSSYFTGLSGCVFGAFLLLFAGDIHHGLQHQSRRQQF